MIKYRLICKNCDSKFDSWFASSNEFERLKKKNKGIFGTATNDEIKELND